MRVAVEPGPLTGVQVPVVVTFPGEGYMPGNAIRWHGHAWTVVFNNRLWHLADCLGLTYLQQLLLRPDSEVSAARLSEIGQIRHRRLKRSAQLVSGDEQLAEIDVPVSDLGDAGPVLDDRAKREYLAAFTRLDDELARAQEIHDLAAQERAQRELEFIRQQLSAGFGRGGRPRRAADVSDRERKAVQKRIADVIDQLTRIDQGLGRHLRASIKTGAYCRYSPPEPIAWNYLTFAEVCAVGRRDAL